MPSLKLKLKKIKPNQALERDWAKPCRFERRYLIDSLYIYQGFRLSLPSPSALRYVFSRYRHKWWSTNVVRHGQLIYMEYLHKILEPLFNGNSPNEWLMMKFIMALVGGFSAYIFKYYFHTTGETRIPFWWKGFWFSIISSFGGVCILGPQTAFNAFVAGLLGWSAIANVLKQENKGASNEQFSENVLTKEQIQELINRGNENG